MSERIRKGTGMILILISILLCACPVIFGKCTRKDFYKAAGKPEMQIMDIPAEQNGPVAVNDADAKTLKSLPGIGETLSGLITKERKENGPFYYAEDLETVRGIGPSTLERIRDLIDLSQKESGE